MTENKYHWYDGWFYDKIIAPNQDKLFGQIKDLIEPGSGIIDIGCGTGRLEFALADKCKSVIGIDLSKKNIDRANLKLAIKPDDKISFRHTGINELADNADNLFNYAILTYVIHEVNEEDRIPLLNDIARIADKIIIGDYLVPRPKGFGSIISNLIEFIAGREHYRNYKTYVSSGGIHYLATKAGLKITDEIENHSYSNQIVVLEK